MRRINERGWTLHELINSGSWDVQLCGLLTHETRFNPGQPYANLDVPLKDLVRYWWDNLADREAVVSGVLEDIMTHYKDRLLPIKRSTPQSDYTAGALDDLTWVIG